MSYKANIIKPEMNLEPRESMLFEIRNSNPALGDYHFAAGFNGDAEMFNKERVAPFEMAATSGPLDSKYLAKVIGAIDSLVAIYFGIGARR